MKRALLAGLAAGCLSVSGAWADPPARSLDVRPVLMPAPVGTYVNAWHNAQTLAAVADQFVIYRQEWFLNGTKPGPYGGYHLQRIMQRLPSVPFLVIIEVDLRDEKINLARQTYVVNQLLAAGITDAPTRVVIGYPRAEGLYGDEAARIFLQRYSGNQGSTSGSYGGGSSSGILGLPGGAMGGMRGY